MKITCTLCGNIKCRFYDICKSPNKDVAADKCPVRFDYECQSRRNKIFGMDFIQISKKQNGVER